MRIELRPALAGGILLIVALLACKRRDGGETDRRMTDADLQRAAARLATFDVLGRTEDLPQLRIDLADLVGRRRTEHHRGGGAAAHTPPRGALSGARRCGRRGCLNTPGPRGRPLPGALGSSLAGAGVASAATACSSTIARRTIAKYRESLGIPSSAQRRRTKALRLA